MKQRHIKRIHALPAGHFPRQKAGSPSIQAVLKQKQIIEQLDITDPTFQEQGDLFNTVQIGHDLNITDVWMSGVTGKNATVAIVDDGLEMYSLDLKDNYFAKGSWDFNDNGPKPRPRLDADRHGTRYAGEVSVVKNNVCGIGIAYDSKIAGLRMLSKPAADADEALAMIYKFDKN